MTRCVGYWIKRKTKVREMNEQWRADFEEEEFINKYKFPLNVNTYGTYSDASKNIHWKHKITITIGAE